MNDSTFQREDRYIVIKRSDLEKVPVGYWSSLIEPIGALQAHLPHRECLVIESDWPEYEQAWRMIERRMAGQPPVTAAEELEAVLHWRDKHAVAIKERDALQQRLNAADQRIDELGQSKELLREAYNEASPRLPYRIRQKIEQFFDGLVVSMSQDAEVAPIKGMIAARGGEYAIMIDENNGHYGWTFRKDPNGMWVSGRKATDAEMQAARQYARHTNQQ